MQLTLPQQDIYFEQLLYPDEPIYNIGAKISIEGNVNVDMLKEAYRVLIDQHDAYRSVVRSDNHAISVLIKDHHDTQLGFLDFSKYPDPANAAENYMETEFRKPFDLTKDSFLHVFTLLKIKENFFYLFSVYHHIITDGWGTSLMFHRLVQNYNELMQTGQVQTLYPFSYIDFANEDLAYSLSSEFETDKAYWKERYSTLPEDLLKKLNPGLTLNKSSRKELVIKREVYNRVITFAGERNATAFHVILAILFTYFGRRNNNNDFAIGIPVLNRSNAKFKKTVGLFMGVTPLRPRFDMDGSFEDLIQQIKQQLKQDYRHQRFPLGQLVKELQLFNEKEKIFNITLSYEKHDYSFHFLDMRTKVIPLTHGTERVALALYIREFDPGEDVKIDFDYNLNYFTGESISSVTAHFEEMLNCILESPRKKLRDINYLAKQEIQELVQQFNSTKADRDEDLTVLNLFEQQVAKTPNKAAVADDENSLSYSEVFKIACTCASFLADQFTGSIEPIGVCVKRSAHLVPLLLGILKAGKYFIPIDPALPAERIRYIIENSGLTKIITDTQFTTGFPVKLLNVHSILSSGISQTTFPVVSGKDTAYIIYTSGSTGKPKGVEIPHSALSNFLLSICQRPGIKPGDLLYAITTYSFDISILEFFAPLLVGATTFIASEKILSEPSETIQQLEKINPAILQATPSFYQMLYTAGWNGNKMLKILCGGDLLSEALAEKLIRTCREVWNMYGPTETTIWSTTKKIQLPADASNIGTPIDNTQIYILDKYLNLLPKGTEGNVYIGGSGLAKGYYNNMELTESKFLQNPFAPGERIYETGDTGKWNEKGEILFLGRNDSQVKVRGYRVELGEIEATINQFFGIDNSVVLTGKMHNTDNVLVAYLPETAGNKKSFDECKEFLRLRLPGYMIPAIFQLVSKFPYTPNNKVDRKALGSLKLNFSISYKDEPTELKGTEKQLGIIWENILSIPTAEINARDSFFSLGGHSLHVVKLMAAILEEFRLNVSMKTIFENNSIKKLAVYIEKQNKTIRPSVFLTAPVKPFYPLTPNQFNIWLACTMYDSFALYNMFAAYKVHGKINKQKLERSVNRLIEKYELLRTVFVEADGAPQQVIRDKLPSAFCVDEFSSDPDHYMKAFSNYEFDPGRELLLKIGIITTHDQEEILMFLSHHLILDGISINLLIKELPQLYQNETGEKKNVTRQFKDYSEWLHGDIIVNMKANELFWNQKLRGYHGQPLFVKDSFPSPGKVSKGRRVSFILPEPAFRQLKDFSTNADTTIFLTLFSIVCAFISRQRDTNDVCAGIVTNGIDNPEWTDIIGMMTNTLPVRIDASEQQSFRQLQAQVTSSVLDVYKHPYLPSQYYNDKFFEVLVVYQNNSASVNDTVHIGDLQLEAIPRAEIIARLPIVFNFYENADHIFCELDYNEEMFGAATIDILVKQFSNLTDVVVKNPDQPLKEYHVSTEDAPVPGEAEIDFNF